MKILKYLTLAVLLISGAASACKMLPPRSDGLNVFMANARPEQVVFVGKVERVENPTSQGMRAAQNIIFLSSKWWRGRPRAIVQAVGYVSVSDGTNCGDSLNFSVEPNEEWLMVGNEIDGVVHPIKHLSRKIYGGLLPENVLSALQSEKDTQK